jgi:CheY-like chemotaxis protein
MLRGHAERSTRRGSRGYHRYWRRLRDADRADRRVGEPDRRSEAEKSEAARATAAILVVDDDPTVRRMTARMLLEDGFTVVEAADGFEALDQCARHPVAVAVMDVRMPRMGGQELARRLAEERPRIRMLFVTGYPGEAVELPDRVLTKPFRPDEFVAIVRSLMDSYWRSAPPGDV